MGDEHEDEIGDVGFEEVCHDGVVGAAGLV